MLVLSRRSNEAIVLPNYDATITILSISAGQVRLGISGPRFAEVYRQEVWERIESEAATLVPAAPVGCTSVPCVPE
jgi:carbon storage regulator CsrA